MEQKSQQGHGCEQVRQVLLPMAKMAAANSQSCLSCPSCGVTNSGGSAITCSCPGANITGVRAIWRYWMLPSLCLMFVQQGQDTVFVEKSLCHQAPRGGPTLLGRDLHPLKLSTLPSRTDPVFSLEYNSLLPNAP